MNHLSVDKTAEGSSDVDELLRDFFRSEMPHPWPALKVPTAIPARRVGAFWGRYSGRMALAACVALLVAGYLSLSAFFPARQIPNGTTPVLPEIGKGSNTPKSQRPTVRPVVNDDGAGESVTPLPMQILNNKGKKSRDH